MSDYAFRYASKLNTMAPMEFALDISFALQSLREACPDALVSLFAYAGDILLGISIFIPGALVHWCIDKKLGQRMMFAYVIGYGLNQTIKNIACVYRPWVLDGRLHIAKAAEATATGYSFPSGHTVSVSAILASLAYNIRKVPIFVTACLGILLMCFIRVFVGAHTVVDVTAAIIVAFVGVTLAETLFSWADAAPQRDRVVVAVGFVATTALFIYLCQKPYPLDFLANGSLLVDPDETIIDVYKAAGLVYGFLVGWYLERHFAHFSVEGTLQQKATRFLRGAAIVGIWFAFSKTALLALGFSLGIAELIKHLVLMLIMMGLYPIAIAKIQKRGE